MTRSRKVTITGALSDQDFYELVALLRVIDDLHPDIALDIVLEDASMTLQEAEQMVDSALPPSSGRTSVRRSVRGK